MVVQHNITAMNANRMLGLTTGSLAKSTEKLSSGYRINRAADDAAGLSISEKMRKQIRGLSQASTNAEDGISAVQTAEGALTEVHSMLQRMNELAVQASNGTLTDETDRKAVQDEIDQLITEVDRVSETTKFNDLYLLKGAQGDQEVSVSYVTALKETPGLQNGKTAPTTWYAKGGTTPLSVQEILDSLDIDADGNVVLKEGKALYKVVATPNKENGAQVKTQLVSNTDIQGSYEKVSNGLRKDAANRDFATEEELKNYFNEDGTYKGGLFGKKTAEPTKTPLNRVSDKPKVTLPPVKDLKAPFDVYLNANVNEALTPSEGEGIRQNVYGSTIMAACFGSEEMKEKVLLAKDEKGKFVFDGSIQDYIIEDSASATITKTGTYTLSVTARGRIDNLVAQGAIWFSVLMDGSVSSTITDFTLIGKSISVQEENYSETYPWTTEIIKDSAGVNRLTVCTQWAMGNDKEKTNTVTDTIEVLKGDKISFTFYVIGTGDAEPSASPQVTESAKPGNLPTAVPSGNGKQQSNTGNNRKWDGGQDDETSVMYVTQKRDMSEEIGEEEQAEFYRSSNKKVATINAKGILVAKAAGKTTITIGLDDGTVLTYPIVVKIPKIVLSKTKIKLPKNSVLRALRVKKKLSTDKIKSYVVSKKKIVTISKRGAIKGLKRGNTTVTVVMKSGAKASCRVTVR